MTSDALNDEDEILFRQIHPTFFEDGHVSSSPFVPTKKDEGKLSVDRSSLTTASGAFHLYTSNGRQSAAVLGVTVIEFGGNIFRVTPTQSRPPKRKPQTRRTHMRTTQHSPKARGKR